MQQDSTGTTWYVVMLPVVKVGVQRPVARRHNIGKGEKRENAEVERNKETLCYQ